MAEIVILGAGVMGSAMTLPAGHGGHAIALVGTHLDEEIVRSLAGRRMHPRLGVMLASSVRACHWTEFSEVMKASPALLILGVSSAGIAWAVERIVESVRTPLPILMLTKGLVARDGSLDILPRFLAREIERRTGMAMPVMAVGGPCIAGELAAKRDTSVVFAGRDEALVERAVALLRAPFYHGRAATDIVGVEVCAAFKNFYALAVGAAAGLLERHGRAQNGAYMHNLSASLFAQSLQEMAILVVTLGGKAETVGGLAGAGDLYVTCQAGRNSRMGRLLGLGLPYSRAKADHMAADTVEGAQLALDLGPTLESMLARGALPAGRMPLAASLVAAICRDAPLEPVFAAFHHRQDR
jgi:glycerol-3-phosphate dehydrogenase (NAD(P)+)